MPESNGHPDFQPIEDKELGVEPVQSWAERVRDDVPWIKPAVKYAQEVLPPNEQKSNVKLTDDQVMQKRDEPVGKSAAFPIRFGENRSVDFSPSRNLRQN